jgi:hypothetical protein
MKANYVLRDNSGGIWTKLFQRNMSPELVLSQAYMPTDNHARIIAREIISSIKGSVRSKFSVTRQDGNLVMARHHSGSYSRGIMKQISPNGEPYKLLEDSTLNIRKLVKNINRSQAFILRETSIHIMNALKIKGIVGSRKYKTARIGWDGQNEQIAILQNKGGEVINPATEYFGITADNVKVEARPFIGLQPELIETFQQMVNQLAVVK